jgi:predicted RND superfamily exporter protein
MFNELNEKFKTIILLAKELRECEDKKNVFMDLKEPIEDESEVTKKKLDLSNFLNTLDFETIQVIETIMNIGKNKDSLERNNYTEIYSENRRDMDKRVWSTKDNEILNVVYELELVPYLLNGLKILGNDINK